MARIRSIKPEFFTSESMGAVSLGAERTFAGIWTIADDRGRLRDQAAVINGALWPLRPEHTAVDLESELGELEREGVICRYTGCDGKRYLHVVNWVHQRVEKPSRSRMPVCQRHRHDDYCGIHDLEDCPPPALNPTGAVPAAPPAPDPEPDEIPVAIPEPSPTIPGVLPEPSGSLHPLDLGSRNKDLGPRTTTTVTPPARRTERASPLSEAAFAEFWSAYPRKVAKGQARAAWTKAVKGGADPAVLTAAAASYRDDPERRRSDPKFTPHPASWLNAQRWLDEPPERTSPQVNGNRPANYFRSDRNDNPFEGLDP